MTMKASILILMACVCVGCAVGNPDVLYKERTKACLEEVKNLSELGGDERCQGIQDRLIHVVNRELEHELRVAKVIYIAYAFNFYLDKYLNAYDNCMKGDDILYTMARIRVGVITDSYIYEAKSWVDKWAKEK